MPVLVGCTSTSTEEAVTLAHRAQQIGSDGVVVLTAGCGSAAGR
ncbi:MAG: hypothetical protein HYU65_02355 [Armatimonadetes bacterium]|nr:hypothetical protein [Armatimonadota bacterium]